MWIICIIGVKEGGIFKQLRSGVAEHTVKVQDGCIATRERRGSLNNSISVRGARQ